MARVQCAVCGKNVDTSKDNCVINNGVVTHKKCPKGTAVLSDKEKEDYKKLTDAIKWLGIKYDKPLNWGLITSQVKQLLATGYNYEDQLFALKYLVDKDGTFWGYGRLPKFMEHAMEHKKKQDEYEKKKAELLQKSKEQETQKVKQASKPSFMNF